jgi:hypothetical protein
MNVQMEEFDVNENLEIMQIIEEWKLDFHLGNAVKHILSSGKKETENEELQDLKRASWYLSRKIQVLNDETCNWENVKDLRNTTFIIPVCVESDDRYKNAKSVLGFLNHHFRTNVIIHELTTESSKLDFIDSLKNLKIKHIVEVNSMEYYHRTKQLNEMLNLVETPVVVNYDIDVILPVESYVEAQRMIIERKSDFVYPYGDGQFQREIPLTFNRDDFNINFDIPSIEPSILKTLRSKYGHCVFANTKKYWECGGENEGFIGYGPEDQEREFRFITLNYVVSRIDDIVYHFEHSRTSFSNGENKYYLPNHDLCSKLMSMKSNELSNYYSTIEYKQKYTKFN